MLQSREAERRKHSTGGRVRVKRFTNAGGVTWCLCALTQTKTQPTLLVAEKTQQRESAAPEFPLSPLTIKHLQPGGFAALDVFARQAQPHRLHAERCGIAAQQRQESTRCT